MKAVANFKLGQNSVKMFEASTRKKCHSSNHLGGVGQAELAGGAKLSDGAYWTHGHLPSRHTGTLSPNSTFPRFPSTVLFSREAKELAWISSLRGVWVSTTVSHQTSTPPCAATPAEHPPPRTLARASSSPQSSRVSESRT